MPNGIPTAAQLTAIESVVRGRTVHDLGAGDLYLSYELLMRGASQVIALDKEVWRTPINEGRSATGLIVKEMSFEAYYNSLVLPVIDVAFVSWPQNTRQEHGLVNLVARAKTIIYLGSNTDCNQCGGPRLFDTLARRRLLVHLPARRNTLLILDGEPLSQPRAQTGEEIAATVAWMQDGPVFTFEQAQTMTHPSIHDQT